MNPEFDKELAAEIDRQLKDLPDLAAPQNLIPRTMKMIARPAAPWHVRPWFAWPASLRVTYLVVTLGAVVGAFPLLREVGPPLFGPMVARFVHWRAGAECLWNALGMLAGAMTGILNHAERGVVLSCALAVLLAYAACVGLGTVFVRLALSGSRKTNL